MQYDLGDWHERRSPLVEFIDVSDWNTVSLYVVMERESTQTTRNMGMETVGTTKDDSR